MALRLKGTAPKPGAPDKRYYMLDVQEGYRRVRLSTGTRDRVAAERKEQAVLDALRDDPEIAEDALRELMADTRPGGGGPPVPSDRPLTV